MLKPILFFLSTILLFSCNRQPTGQQLEAADTSTVQHENAVQATGKIDPVADFKFHSMLANLPSPLKMFEIISGSKVQFAQNKLTPMEKATQLPTTDSKAFGYGVFMTDLGYLAFQNNKQEALKYLQTCRELAQELGAGEVFDRTISSEFEESTASPEKFAGMMETGFEAMDSYMKDNERFVNSTQIFIGSWTESQLLATNLLIGKELSAETKGIYQGIYEQKIHASNLVNVLGEIQDQVDPQIYASIEDLMLFYAGFSGIESINQQDLKELKVKLETLKSNLFSLAA